MKTYPVKIIYNKNIIKDKLILNLNEIKDEIKNYKNLVIINWYSNHGNLDTGLYQDVFFNQFILTEYYYLYIFSTIDNIDSLILNNINIIISVNESIIKKYNNKIILNSQLTEYFNKLSKYHIYCTGDESHEYNIYNNYNIKFVTYKRNNVNNSINLSLPFSGLNKIQYNFDRYEFVKEDILKFKQYHNVWIGNISNARPERKWFLNIQKLLNEEEFKLNNFFLNTKKFFNGISRNEYYEKLFYSKFSWCLDGLSNIDTFRVYESLESFCVPIVVKNNYWDTKYKFVLEIDNLNNSNIINLFYKEIFTNPILYIKLFNHLYSNWRKYIWKQSRNINDTLILNNKSDTKNNLTVIITSSVIQNHPDTEMIEQVIDSIYNYSLNINIIIVCDGQKTNFENKISYDYEYYKYSLLIKLKTKYKEKNILPIFMEKFCHQSDCVKEAINFVSTDHILFMEHDCTLRDKIDIVGIIDLMNTNKDINMVQFSCNSSIFKNKKLDIAEDWGINGELLLEKKCIYYNKIPLLRTCKYSARPHIIRKSTLNYFLQFVNNEYIEDKIYSIAMKEHQKLGMYIYYPPLGDPYCIPHNELGDGIDIRRHTHLDGRKNGSKIYEKQIQLNTNMINFIQSLNEKNLVYFNMTNTSKINKIKYQKFMEKICYDGVINWHTNKNLYTNHSINKIFVVGFNRCATRTIYDMFSNKLKCSHFTHNNKNIAKICNTNFINDLPLLNSIDDSCLYCDMEGGIFSEINIFKFFPLLDKQNPNSKFILPIRNIDKWILSRLKHESYAEKKMLYLNLSVHELIGYFKDEYNEHISYVKNYFIRDVDDKRKHDFIIVNIDDDKNWQDKIIEFFKNYNIHPEKQLVNKYAS